VIVFSDKYVTEISEKLLYKRWSYLLTSCALDRDCFMVEYFLLLLGANFVDGTLLSKYILR